MADPTLISSDAEVAALVERSLRAPEVALDCEFHGERRYRPTLYLVQLGVEGEAFAIDAQRAPLPLLRPLLESADVRKLFHAGREDIRLLTRATGATGISNTFDTQVAAAFLGHGLTVGYARLVEATLGVVLDKANQYTDWSGKLTSAQLDYALNDVRYLPRAAAVLEKQLEERGRLAWALSASDAAARQALVDPDPGLLYRKVSGFGRLDETELGRLRELAIWRDQTAELENCRPESIVNDAALRQLASRPPKRQADLRGMRGVATGGSERYWKAFLEAVARGDERPEPRPTLPGESDPRIEAIFQLLGAVRRVVSIEHDVAAEVLASTADLKSLAEWHVEQGASRPDLELFRDFREALIGAPLLGILAGEVTLRVDRSAKAGLLLTR